MGKKKRGKKISKALYVFYFLLILNLLLGGLNLAKARGMLIPTQPKPLVVDGIVDLDDLNLQQKIAQMVLALGWTANAKAYQSMQIGGVYLYSLESENVFRETIRIFQEGMDIPFMISVDLEGCFNPFANFRGFKPAGEVQSVGEAFEKGHSEGKFLSELGITMNFAPVVDLDDTIWKCRSFPGDEEKITELANAYILGLQDQDVLATAKHYPGKTLVIRDIHKYLAAAEIAKQDLFPYERLISKKNIQAIMVSHIIVSGEVDSEGKPSVVSKKLIDQLREDFDGLIITDEINMQGLRKYYDSDEEMYLDVFTAGSDIVLNFDKNPNDLYEMISVIEEAVERGEISEKRIDNSVKRILEFKGFRVRG